LYFTNAPAIEVISQQAGVYIQGERMTIVGSKFFSMGLYFLFIFLSGFWLSRQARPHPVLLVTLHKLIALAAGVYLGLTVYRAHQVTPLDPLQIAAVAVTALLFAVNVATGSLLSSKAVMPEVVTTLNKAVPFLTVVSTGVVIYLLI
jgi:hypothetical protein